MKKTFPVNIDGQIFYIDEDAYNLLNKYLEQLHISFRGEEGKEIVSDIESRIRELFNNRLEGGKSVVTLADVNEVIETMGRPEDISDNNEAERGNTEDKKSEPREEQPFITINLPSRKKLYRSTTNKIFGGVFGGLAVYLGWNANIMRLFYIALACVSYFWPLTVLYLIAWMIIPAAVTPKQILEMKGEQINIDTVGQAVRESIPTPPPYNEEGDFKFWKTVSSIIGKTLMAFLGFATGCVTVISMIFFLVILVAIIAWAFFSYPALLEGLDIPTRLTTLVPGMIMLISALLLAIVVCGSITWGAISVVFNTKGMSTAAIWSAVILSVCCIVTMICCSPFM